MNRSVGLQPHKKLLMKDIAVALALLLIAGAASAQTVPIPRSDFEEAAAQYRSYALSEFHGVVQEWVSAINADAADRAVRLYTEDAYVDIEQPARGRKAVADLLAGWEGGVRQLQVGLSDFDASGNMSYGTLNVRLVPEEGAVRSGMLLLVMRKEGRSWRIRAQTLTLF